MPRVILDCYQADIFPELFHERICFPAGHLDIEPVIDNWQPEDIDCIAVLVLGATRPSDRPVPRSIPEGLLFGVGSET